MTGPELVEMIVHLNSDAKKMGGRLSELALPVELFETLRDYLQGKKALRWVVPEKRFQVDGVDIHTGEDD